MLKSAHENNVYPELIKLLKSNQLCVLATVTKTRGSTPQKSGSSAIFGQTELLAGTIGGGVTELRVKDIAQKVLKLKESCYHSFDLAHDISDDSEAICGGGMDILLDSSPEEHTKVFENVIESLNNRIPGILVTILKKTGTLIKSTERIWITVLNFKKGSSTLKSEIKNKIQEMLQNPVPDDFCTLKIPLEQGNQIVLLETIAPSPQLTIAGAGHVGKALSHLANLLNFEVTVWDDRKEFANREHLPDAHKVIHGNLEESLKKIAVDSTTYLVIVTHGHKNDSEVLKAFINSPAAYIGMIGSRKKVAKVKNMFLEKGWATRDQWDGIYAPVGLDIHSKTVQEIAVSIAAQLIMVRNQKSRIK
jgi:xanthine dehydrogenase accessory factor